MTRPDGTLGERETLIEIPAIEIAGKNLGRPDGTVIFVNAIGLGWTGRYEQGKGYIDFDSSH